MKFHVVKFVAVLTIYTVSNVQSVSRTMHRAAKPPAESDVVLISGVVPACKHHCQSELLFTLVDHDNCKACCIKNQPAISKGYCQLYRPSNCYCSYYQINGNKPISVDNECDNHCRSRDAREANRNCALCCKSKVAYVKGGNCVRTSSYFSYSRRTRECRCSPDTGTNKSAVSRPKSLGSGRSNGRTNSLRKF